MICGYDTHFCKNNTHVQLFSPTCYDNRPALWLIEQPQMKEVLDGAVVSLLDSLFGFALALQLIAMSMFQPASNAGFGLRSIDTSTRLTYPTLTSVTHWSRTQHDMTLPDMWWTHLKAKYMFGISYISFSRTRLWIVDTLGYIGRSKCRF